MTASAAPNDATRGLREFMGRHRLDQRELARRAGIHETSISRLFNHPTNPSKATLDAILLACRALEPAIGYDDLFSPQQPQPEAVAG